MVPGSPGDEAGLLLGDVILQVDGKELTMKLGDLLGSAKYEKASSFTLTVRRGGVAQAELAPLEMEGGVKLQGQLTMSI